MVRFMVTFRVSLIVFGLGLGFSERSWLSFKFGLRLGLDRVSFYLDSVDIIFSETRIRSIVTSPDNGGAQCPPLSQVQACNTQACGTPHSSLLALAHITIVKP